MQSHFYFFVTFYLFCLVEGCMCQRVEVKEQPQKSWLFPSTMWAKRMELKQSGFTEPLYPLSHLANQQSHYQNHCTGMQRRLSGKSAH